MKMKKSKAQYKKNGTNDKNNFKATNSTNKNASLNDTANNSYDCK